MDSIRNYLILAFTLPLIGALAVGCNTGTEEPDAPKTETAAEAAALNGNADTDTEATRPPDEIDPSRFAELPAGTAAAVPDNYLEDLPLYPGAVASLGRGDSSEAGETAGFQLLTNDSPDQAFGYYRDELESKGWDIRSADEESERMTIAVTKDNCKAIFMFVPSETGTGTDIVTISSCED
jgi:hypothetical protein